MSNTCDASNKESCSSTEQSCNTEQKDSECCNMPEKLLCLADEAWKELLKEKIKAEIEKTSGQKLNNIAKLVSEANHRRWSHQIEGKQKCDEFKQQLKEAFLSK
jgi:hypothetical protein